MGTHALRGPRGRSPDAVQAERPRNLAHLSRDRGYRYGDRDPDMDEICRIITDSGKSVARIAAESGVSATTMYNWLDGKTKRPQNVTVAFVARFCGYERVWTKQEK